MVMHAGKAVPLRTLVALDERVSQARANLQRITDADPTFEHQVRALVELVRKRDRAWDCCGRTGPRGPVPPPAA